MLTSHKKKNKKKKKKGKRRSSKQRHLLMTGDLFIWPSICVCNCLCSDALCSFCDEIQGEMFSSLLPLLSWPSGGVKRQLTDLRHSIVGKKNCF